MAKSEITAHMKKKIQIERKILHTIATQLNFKWLIKLNRLSIASNLYNL